MTATTVRAGGGCLLLRVERGRPSDEEVAALLAALAALARAEDIAAAAASTRSHGGWTRRAAWAGAVARHGRNSWATGTPASP